MAPQDDDRSPRLRGIVVHQQADAGRSAMQSRRYSRHSPGAPRRTVPTPHFRAYRLNPRHGHTRLVTEPFDQGQLHGLLNRVRDFGFDLLAVEAIPPDHS